MNKLEEPQLGGGIGASDWLRQIAEGFRDKAANTRAAEAERIADWLDELSYGEGLRAIALEDADTVTRLVDDIRAARLEIAETLIQGVRNRYSEVEEPKIEPLTDTKIVLNALARELQAQERVINDLSKEDL